MRIETVAEEVLDRCTDANNGAGPLWCFGSPTIVRDGARVFASVWQVGEGVKPLCNTRWQLFRREDGGAPERVNVSPEFNEREPCPLMRLPGGRILLSVNPARALRHEGADGRNAYTCEPHLLQFDAARPDAPPQAVRPVWDSEYEFTEHSYRAAAADRESGELIVLDQVQDPESAKHKTAPDYSQAWAWRDAAGEWPRQGLLGFPIRGCYCQVALRRRAVFVFAVSDIIEPVPAWREFKRKVTGTEWDYEFRQLFFTWTPDVTSVAFSPVLTVASRDETAGLLRNLDMWVSADGEAHLLYLDRNVWHAFMRDEFFPGLPLSVALKYCRIRRGIVVERRTLVECVEEDGGGTRAGRDNMAFAGRGAMVDCGALHATPDGRLLALYHAETAGERANWILPLVPRGEAVKLDLEFPLARFFTASERMGSAPSDAIDLYGTGEDASTIRYAQLKIC